MPVSTTPISEGAAADGWGSVFRDLVNTAIDTGAEIALRRADTQQSEALAQQATETAKVNATTQQAVATTAASNWKTYAIVGGVALVGVVALVLILRKSN